MAITFGTPLEYVDTASFAVSKTINLATGAVAGDYRIVQLVGLPNGTTPGADSFSVDVPTGWTEIGVGNNSSAASDQWMTMIYRKWQSGDANTLTVNFTGGSLAIAAISVVVSGADPDTFLDVAVPTFNAPEAVQQWQCPTITTVTDNAFVIRAVCGDAAPGAGIVDGDVPTGHTIFGTHGSSTPSNGWGAGMAYEEQVTAGSAGTADWGSISEEHVGATFAIRPGPTDGIFSVDSTYGVGADELDFDDTDVDVNGGGFGATIGASDVYLSPNDLLSETGEVDITAAVNTWADGVINLDFSQLSQGVIDDLHTMGPGARFIIVNVGGVPATTEYFIAVTLHRPKPFEMVLSSNFAPSGTSQRLTGLTGTFGGGRIEEALNPSTTDTNVADDGNREDVQNVQATPGSRAVSYDFRVLYGGNVPDTITQTPQVTVSIGNDVTLPSASLTVTGNVPQAVTTEKHISVLATATLTVTANVPTVETFDPNVSQLPTATLTIVGWAPNVTATEHHFSVLPSADLTVTGNAPSIEATEHRLSQPPDAALVITANVPQAVTTENRASILPAATLTITANAPTVVALEHRFSVLPSATLTLTPNVPQAITASPATFVGHAIEISTLQQQTTSATYSKPGAAGTYEIEGSELVGSANYLLVVRLGIWGNNSSADIFEWRVTENSVGELTGSHARLRPRHTGGVSPQHYFYIRKVLTAATPNDYEIEYKSNGTDAVGVYQAELVMINLDDISADDWAYDNDAVDNSFVAGVWEDGASITIGDGFSDWLILNTAQWDINSGSDDCRGRINIGGATVQEYALEATVTVEEDVIGTVHYEPALAADTVVKNQFTNTGSLNDVLDNSIVALRLNAFEDHAGARNTTSLAFNGPTRIEPITLTHTADTVNDPETWVAFANVIVDVDGSTLQRTRSAIYDGEDSAIVGTVTGNPDSAQNGVQDWIPWIRIGEVSEADATDLDWKATVSAVAGGTVADAIENTLVGFTWELSFDNVSFLPSASLSIVGNVPQAIATDSNTSQLATATLTVTANAPQATTTENHISLLTAVLPPVSVTGTPHMVDAAAASGSDSVTVPADCTMIIAMWSQLDGGTGNNLDSCDIASDAFVIQWNVGDSGSIPGRGIATLENPATGAQTFSWAWTGTAQASGGAISLTFVKGQAAVDPILDAKQNGEAAGQGSIATTLFGTSLDSFIIVQCSIFQDICAINLNGGETLVDDYSYNDYGYDVARVGANTPFSGISSASADTIVGIALASASSGGEALLTLTANAPTVVATEHRSSVLPSAALALTANVPSAVTAEGDISVLPSAALAITANVPQAIATEKNTSVLPSAALVITNNAPLINVSEGFNEFVNMATATLTLTANAPTAMTQNEVALPSASLIVTGNVPSAVTFDPNTSQLSSASLVITANAPQAVVTNVSQLPSAALTLTANVPQAIVTEANLIGLPSVSLLVTPAAPSTATTELNYSVLPSAALTIAVSVPTVVSAASNRSILPSASLTVVGNVPQTVNTEANVVTLISADLLLTANVPTVEVFDHHTSQLPSATLTLTANVPQVAVQANEISFLPSVSLTIVGNVPGAETTEKNVAVLPSASLVIVPNAPSVEVFNPHASLLATAVLTVTGNAPNAVVAEKQIVLLPSAVLTVTGNVPTVDIKAGNVIVMPTASLVITANAPNIFVPGNELAGYNEPDILDLTDYHEFILIR